MARRRADNGASVNLFPFLSILVCIIGCLTLIIVVINLIAMSKGEGRTPEEVERAREYLEAKKEREEKQEEADRRRQLIENLIAQNKEIIEARDKLALLKDMLENQEEIDASREELIARFNLLTDTNKKLDRDHKDLMAQIEEKEKEIARRKLPPEPAALQVRPSGSSSATVPHFVEVSDAGVYIHTSLSGEPEAIPASSLNQSEAFIALLDKIASQRNFRLIFLVRGDEGAVKTLNAAAKTISGYNRQKGTEIIPGRLPLPGEGKVDLSVFADYLEP